LIINYIQSILTEMLSSFENYQIVKLTNILIAVINMIFNRKIRWATSRFHP